MMDELCFMYRLKVYENVDCVKERKVRDEQPLVVVNVLQEELPVVLNNSWRKLAACRGMPIEIFFPKEELVRSSPRSDKRLLIAFAPAIAVCAECPVKGICSKLALEVPNSEDHWGIFGGMTPKERSDIRRNMGN
jgi:hypothetical protein